MPSFKSVTHRLIFWILGASASLFLVISYYEHFTAEYFLQQQMRSKADLTKADMVTRVENMLDQVMDSVETAALILPLTTINQSAINALLKKLVSQQDAIYGMTIALEPRWSRNGSKGFAPYYYQKDGRLEYADLSLDSYDYRSHAWYETPARSGEASWSEPYFDQGGGDVAMVTYSKPIYADQARTDLVGVVTADIALDRFKPLVSQLAIGERGFAYIFTRDGNVITHSNPDMVMRNLADATAQTSGSRQYRSVISGMQQGLKDTLHLECRHSTNGECWLSYQPIANTQWSIAILIPMDELATSLEDYRFKSLAITLAGLLLLSIIVVLISRRVTVPLHALTRSIQALGRGEMNVSIEDYGLRDEVGTLARQFQRMQQALRDYIEKLKLETAQRERIEGELGAAHEIQMQMLPDQGRSDVVEIDWQLNALLEPAKSVGGDFYHYQMLDSGELFFAVGDVSDKGVPAALFMAKTQTLLRQLCTSGLDLAQLLCRINQQLCQENHSCMFVTLVCGQLNIETGELLLASAGHTPPLVLSGGNLTTIDIETGAALGFYEDTNYSSHRITLNRNAPLLLFTDGVDEASNSSHQLYGEERLKTVMRDNYNGDSKELLQTIMTSIVEFRAEAEPSDDLTMMIITRH